MGLRDVLCTVATSFNQRKKKSAKFDKMRHACLEKQLERCTPMSHQALSQTALHLDLQAPFTVHTGQPRLTRSERQEDSATHLHLSHAERAQNPTLPAWDCECFTIQSHAGYAEGRRTRWIPGETDPAQACVLSNHCPHHESSSSTANPLWETAGQQSPRSPTPTAFDQLTRAWCGAWVTWGQRRRHVSTWQARCHRGFPTGIRFPPLLGPHKIRPSEEMSATSRRPSLSAGPGRLGQDR